MHALRAVVPGKLRARASRASGAREAARLYLRLMRQIFRVKCQLEAALGRRSREAAPLQMRALRRRFRVERSSLQSRPEQTSGNAI